MTAISAELREQMRARAREAVAAAPPLDDQQRTEIRALWSQAKSGPLQEPLTATNVAPAAAKHTRGSRVGS